MTSQNLKQLKESLKHFKKEKKTLESEINEIEKQYKQLNTKHQIILKTLENKCTYWTTVDELLLKIKMKCDYINNLTLNVRDSDILSDKHLETLMKYLKVNSLYYLIIV